MNLLTHKLNRPAHIPERVLPGSAGAASHVRGFAMEIRNFNNEAPINTTTTSVSLATNFNKETLRKMHKRKGVRLYRKPCINCLTLLPTLDVPAGDADYDRDMLTFMTN